MKRWGLWLGMATVALACKSGDGRGTDSGASASITITTSGTTEATATSTGETTAGSGEADTHSPVFDLGIIPDSPELEMGCDKVDFLFIIDNSGSMQTSQENLIANFGTFITGIQQTLDDVNEYQVGIVTTDKYEYNVAGCQTDLSALVVQTGGNNSSMATCGPYAAGNNYMTELDDLTQTFSCAAQVGTQGGGLELPMMTLQQTVNETLDGPGLCNEGFLRDDSLLVTVIITDEADGPDDWEITFPNPQGGPSTSPGTPQEWFDDVVAARSGIEENVVVLSLIHYWDGACPPPQEPYDGWDGKNIKEFTEMFTHGFVGGICEPDYGPYFQEAIGIIDEACTNFMPPG